MQINDQIILTIKDIGSNGEGVGFIGNKPVFVPYCLPNEKVKVKLTKITNNYYFATLIEVIEKSHNRVDPKCPYFYECGGCQLQHLNYENQLQFKTNLVRNNFKKYANILEQILPCEASENEYFYRNKMELKIGKFNNNYVVGFYKNSTNCIVPINSCVLHEKWAEDVIWCLNNYIDEVTIKSKYYANYFNNILSIVVRFLNGNLQLTLVTKNNQLLYIKILINLLKTKFKKFDLLHNINKTHFMFGKTFKVLYGNLTNNVNTFGIKQVVSPDSFLQINQKVQNKLYNQVLNEVSSNANVIDAYSGAGLLSAIISKKVKKVYAIEIIENAVKDANQLMQNNNIKNIENICGDCKKILPKLLRNLDNLEIILDPPRKGCDEYILKLLANSKNINKIIYISCSSNTLARDVKILLQNNNYSIKYTKPFDMFPQTSHVETLIVLEKV